WWKREEENWAYDSTFSTSYALWGGRLNPDRTTKVTGLGPEDAPEWHLIEGPHIKLQYWKNSRGVTGYNLSILDHDILDRNIELIERLGQQRRERRRLESEGSLRF